jgi:2-aminobenzoate-CoA ligase
VVFGGFSADALRGRIQDGEAKLVITADGGHRRGSIVPLKANTDAALDAPDLPVEKVLVVQRIGEGNVQMREGRDVWWHEELSRVSEDATVEPEHVDAEHPLYILYTSGTTGKPKGTVHFHRDVVAMCDCFPRSILKAHKDDIFVGTPPLAFTFGLGGLLCFPMRVGASTVLVEKHTPETLLETVQRFRASVCFAAPIMYRGMAAIAQDFDLSSLKKCVSAGEALPDATRQLFKEATGIEIIDGIGSTEMIHIFISHTPEQVRRGATGYAVPGYEAVVLDEEGKRCQPGTVGRLAVKGPTGCRYLADERQRNYVQNGWNVTGDAYMVDRDGYFFYQARTDDMIISAGYNIAGPEVEDALLKHPAVAECGVVGAADADRGTIVKAYVVLKSGNAPGPETVQVLQDHVKKVIAPYKYPRAIEFVDTLPRTETGKLQRFKLRAA